MKCQLKYNYVFFNTLDGHAYKDYPDGYNTICAKDLKQFEEIEVVNAPLYYKPKFFRLLYTIHNSAQANRLLSLPFKNIWYPLYFKDKGKKGRPYCFVLLYHLLPISYLSYLKKQYPDCRIVLLHRDLAAVCNKANPVLSGNPILDLEMTYDRKESLKYGWPLFSEYESKIEIKLKDQYESDVFFAGRAKGRLPQLLKAYDVIAKAGLKVFFYLTDVPSQDRKELPGIQYAEKGMSYIQMLEHTVNTRCVLEINYGGTEGYTSRFLESVIYGKRLITNNPFVKESQFYTKSNIQYVSDTGKIDTNFIVAQPTEVDYNYNGEFSPINMILRIEEE